MYKEGFKLIGISLGKKTNNAEGQSVQDIGGLWQRFEKEQIFDKIPNKLDFEVVAVYHSYEGDHTNPFAYFIGCRVADDVEVPSDLESLRVDAGNYQLFVAKGKMPDCIGEAWSNIWIEAKDRAYTADYEVYGEKSQDWSNAEVDIFISIR